MAHECTLLRSHSYLLYYVYLSVRIPALPNLDADHKESTVSIKKFHEHARTRSPSLSSSFDTISSREEKRSYVRQAAITRYSEVVAPKARVCAAFRTSRNQLEGNGTGDKERGVIGWRPAARVRHPMSCLRAGVNAMPSK